MRWSHGKGLQSTQLRHHHRRLCHPGTSPLQSQQTRECTAGAGSSRARRPGRVSDGALGYTSIDRPRPPATSKWRRCDRSGLSAGPGSAAVAGGSDQSAQTCTARSFQLPSKIRGQRVCRRIRIQQTCRNPSAAPTGSQVRPSGGKTKEKIGAAASSSSPLVAGLGFVSTERAGRGYGKEHRVRGATGAQTVILSLSLSNPPSPSEPAARKAERRAIAHFPSPSPCLVITNRGPSPAFTPPQSRPRPP